MLQRCEHVGRRVRRAACKMLTRSLTPPPPPPPSRRTEREAVGGHDERRVEARRLEELHAAAFLERRTVGLLARERDHVLHGRVGERRRLIGGGGVVSQEVRHLRAVEAVARRAEARDLVDRLRCRRACVCGSAVDKRRARARACLRVTMRLSACTTRSR